MRILVHTTILLATLGAPGVLAQEDLWQEEDEYAQGEADEEPVTVAKASKVDETQAAREAESLRAASSQTVRRFHEVLDELLAEFGYDVKMGQIKGLKNLSLRKISVSKAIPRTYESYLEMLLAERIWENSRIKLIACVPCKTRTSSVVDGKLLITSPATNLAKLESAATMLGIENFMDAVLVYHTTHMVLAISVFNAQTKELVWARTYNSETIKSRYQKLAVDYSQVAKSRPGEDYVPEYRFLFGLGGGAIPNVAGDKNDSSMLNLQIRGTEKFNNRKTEFGMLLSIYKSTRSILNDYPSEGEVAEDEADVPTVTEKKVDGPTPEPFQQAYAIYGIWAHNFVGAIESYNETRHGIHAGIGAIAATGYLAPTARVGWDVYFGRRFAVSLGASYIMKSEILVDGEAVETKGGGGGDLVVSLNY